jgi:hypothetical protein
MASTTLPASRLGRIAILTATGVLLVGFALEFAWLWGYIGSQNAIGTDHAFYKRIGETWLATGQFYLPHQLAGPYVEATDVDVMYPPLAIPFFAALHWLPFPLWYAIPLGVVAYAVWRWHPAAWTWPILALLLAWPRGVSNIIYGNSDIWIMGAIAGGLLLGWPAALVFLKPSLFPLAFLGANRRSFWIAVAVMAVASLFFLDLWRQYATAIHNSDANWYWSLGGLPALLLPVVAWLGRRDGGFESVGAVLSWRPGWPRTIRLPVRDGRPSH